MQIEEIYPEVCEYLKALHIDPRRPFELMPLEPDEHNRLEYIGCQYIVFGECEDTYTQPWNEVVVKKATTHLSTGIDEQHFVLEFSPIRLQWLLQE